MSWKVSATIQSTGLPLLLKRAWKNDAIVFSDEELVLAAFIAVLVKARRCASLVCDSGRTLLYPSCAENPAVQGGDVERGEQIGRAHV